MLSELLEQHAIIQAPMAGFQGAELAIAVCAAGGIGSLPAALLNTEQLRSELQQISTATSAAYNVNFFCHKAIPPDAASMARWRATLDPYYTELDADHNAAAGPSRTPFNDEALRVLAEYKPKIISFHFGLPSDELLAGVRAWGAYVLCSATSVEEALWMQGKGVDGVIAQGIEAGGHQGRFLQSDQQQPLRCLELARAISSQVSVPVIAAGGIASREHAQMALAGGAAAVQVGSAFLQAHEATTSAIHRAALQSEAAKITELTNVFSGRRARGIVNRMMRELGPISHLAPVFPHAAAAIAPLRSAAEARGSGDFSPLWSGERGYLSQELPAGEITRLINPKVG